MCGYPSSSSRIFSCRACVVAIVVSVSASCVKRTASKATPSVGRLQAIALASAVIQAVISALFISRALNDLPLRHLPLFGVLCQRDAVAVRR